MGLLNIAPDLVGKALLLACLRQGLASQVEPLRGLVDVRCVEIDAHVRYEVEIHDDVDDPARARVRCRRRIRALRVRGPRCA